MACREIINLINWRSRLLQCPLTTRVTKPTKTGTPAVGGGRGTMTTCTPSLSLTSQPVVSTPLKVQLADAMKKTKQKNSVRLYTVFSRVGGQYAHAHTETKGFTAKPMSDGHCGISQWQRAFCSDDVKRYIHYVGLSADPHIT